MKLWQKIAFIAVLVLFISASVTISLISISRATYDYREETAIGGEETLNGWVFTRFNGNGGTKVLYADYVRDKKGGNPDETKPVVAIGAYVVNADEYAEELVIGKSVQRIEETAFFNLKKLRKITVDPANEWFTDIDGVLYTKDEKKLLLYPACRGQGAPDEQNKVQYAVSYTVPEGVERIASFAFLKNEYLRDLTLPSSLREIGDMAFFGCAMLGSYQFDTDTDTMLGSGFTLPDGLEKIGSDAFSKCSSISPLLYIPASVKEIGHHAFFSCTGMTDVFLGAADEGAVSLGESWLPKSIKGGALWKTPDPQYGKTREETQERIEAYRAEQLTHFREAAQKNG